MGCVYVSRGLCVGGGKKTASHARDGGGIQSGFEDAVIRRERKARDHHVFDELARARVIARAGGHREVPGGEQNEVLEVAVPLHVLLVVSHGLVELRLQERARVEGGDLGLVGRVAPVGGEAQSRHAVGELLKRLRAFGLVGVGLRDSDSFSPLFSSMIPKKEN